MPSKPTSENSYLACLTNRDFLLFYLGQYISFIGDRLAQVAFIAVLMGTIAAGEAATGSSTEVTRLMMFSLVPYLVMFPLSGWIIDRFRRRNVMIICTCIQGVVTIISALIIRHQGFHDTAQWVIYGSVFLIYMNSAVFNPAKYALIPELIPTKHLLAANALNTSTATISTLIGTFLGGFWLIPWLHGLTGDETNSITWSLWLDSLTFFIPALLLFFIRGDQRAASHQEPRQTNIGKQLAEGFHYIFTHGALWRLMCVVACTWTVAGMFWGSLNEYTIETLGAGIKGYSLVQGTIGLGMFTGAIGVGLLCRRTRPRHVIAVALLLTGLSLLVTRLTLPVRGLRVFALFATAAFAGSVIVNLDTLYQRIVPNFIRGRIFSINFLITTSALIFGMGLQLVLDSTGLATKMANLSYGIMTPQTVYFQLTGLIALVGFVAVHRSQWQPISGKKQVGSQM